MASERRLAAILSADVAGYSRLMAEDEQGTIQTLTAYRSLINSLVGDHHGRVVDSPGDNLLAEFPNALDAVQCAVEVQGVLRVRNQSLAESRQMSFRIGVHLGDITAEGDRIYGDGVNIAARLEALAEPGGVCISAAVHEQVRGKLELGYVDLGEQEVKNIPDPVRVYRVSIEAGAPGVAHALNGEWADGLATLEDTLQSMREKNTFLLLEAETLTWIARCRLELGDLEGVRATLAETPAVAERIGARLHLPHLHLVEARLAMCSGAGDEEIESALGAAFDAVRAMGARLWEPFVELARAEWRELRGDDAGRQAATSEAVRVLREMGAEAHAGRVARELEL